MRLRCLRLVPHPPGSAWVVTGSDPDRRRHVRWAPEISDISLSGGRRAPRPTGGAARSPHSEFGI